MTPHEINSIFATFQHLNILVIGDVMIDAYLWGKVNRISPEAPVPIVAASRKENRLGGAANVALNLSALGANPILCTVIGDDAASETFFELLDAAGLSAEGIMISGKRATTIKTRVISGTQHLLRIDEEITTDLTENLARSFIHQIEQIIKKKKIHAIIFEDYDKGLIVPDLIRETIELARNFSIKTLVDPKKKNFTNYAGVSFFKPNLKELTEGIKKEFQGHDLDAIRKHASEFQQKYEIEVMLTTLSENGMMLTFGNQWAHIPAQIRTIADVSGAGDTVISIAAACLAAHATPLQAAIIANLGGGLVCEKVGVVPIEFDVLKTETLQYFEQTNDFSTGILD